MFINSFFFENRAVFEIMWVVTVERNRPQTTIWRMCIPCWILKATNAHSVYVIFIVCPLQQWLHERTSMSRYTHIVCLVMYSFRNLSYSSGEIM